MKHADSMLRSAARVFAGGCRQALGSVTGHWALAIFSLLAAFGIWVAVQDVDNPRVEDIAPTTGIPVEAVNIPEGFLVEDLPLVRVKVEARKSVLAELRPDDFEAKVDVRRAAGEGTSQQPVRVTSRRSGVRVVEQPLPIEITLVEAAQREIQVTINESGSLPEDVQLTGLVIEPQVVTIRGKRDLVESVATVDLDVNLRTVRDQTVFEGELVARTRDRNTVQVQLSQTHAKATYKVEQIFSQRTIALTPSIIGTPDRGFLVTNVVVDPPTVLVSGPKNVIDQLKTLSVEKVDVTGAQKTTIVSTRQVERPPNVSVDRQTVVVRVEIQAADCGGTDRSVACGSAAFAVALLPETSLPAGLAPDGLMNVIVRVTGPLAQVSALKLADIKATVALSGAVAGTASYPVKVTVPAGLRADADPVTITLVPRAPAVLP